MGTVDEVTATAVGGGVRRVLGVTVALAAVALGGAGCQSVAKTRADMRRAVGLSKPTAPAQFICMVQSGLQDLPDTTRGGRPTKAVIGKMFLFGSDRQPAEANGQLTLMMTDATPRPPGAPARTPEVANIDAVALKSLKANDERFGPCYAFIIPWPEDWVGVNQIAIQATFKPDPSLNAATMYHQVMKVSLNENLVVIDQKTGMPKGATVAAPAMGSVPDPDMLRAQVQAGGQPTGMPELPPVHQTGYVPPTTTAGPSGSGVTSQAWAAPTPTTPPMPSPPTPPTGGPIMPVIPPAVTPSGTPPAGNGVQVWPPPSGAALPPVGPIGELQPDGMLRPVVIKR